MFHRREPAHRLAWTEAEKIAPFPHFKLAVFLGCALFAVVLVMVSVRLGYDAGRASTRPEHVPTVTVTKPISTETRRE